MTPFYSELFIVEPLEMAMRHKSLVPSKDAAQELAIQMCIERFRHMGLVIDRRIQLPAMQKRDIGISRKYIRRLAGV